MASWVQYSFSIPSSKFGHSLVLGFNAKSSTTATTIRVDDVSLTYISSPSCSYSISPSSISPTASSGSGSVLVTTTSVCSWTAVSNNTSWLNVTNGSSGTGNGTVSYSYTSNGTSSSRTGTITIAGKTFTVTQAGNTSSPLLGVDVSRYQGVIDWPTVYSVAGKKFAYVKATEGINYGYTSYFTTNIAAASAAGVISGAYHYARPNSNSAIAEANYFLSIAGAYIGANHLPPALDIENPDASNYATSHSVAELETWIKTWMATVKNATGVRPVIYCPANLSPFTNFSSALSDSLLWIVNQNGSTNPPPSTYIFNSWLFKQYKVAPKGTISGIDSAVDLDVFNGDLTAFNNLINPSSSKPDLTITAATQSVSPSSVAAGSNITAYASEGNSGPATAGSTVVGLWLSSDDVLNTNSDIYLGEITGYPSLTPNTNSLIKSATVTIPSGTSTGAYYLFFWADGGTCGASSTCSNCSGSVVESNECNNFASAIINITCSIPGHWTGTVSSAWENPNNWSCGILPDANTNVTINSGTVIVNSNVICRTLTVMPGVIFTVSSPFKLTIAH